MLLLDKWAYLCSIAQFFGSFPKTTSEEKNNTRIIWKPMSLFAWNIKIETILHLHLCSVLCISFACTSLCRPWIAPWLLRTQYWHCGMTERDCKPFSGDMAHKTQEGKKLDIKTLFMPKLSNFSICEITMVILLPWVT